jgi:hypothetical protein
MASPIQGPRGDLRGTMLRTVFCLAFSVRIGDRRRTNRWRRPERSSHIAKLLSDYENNLREWVFRKTHGERLLRQGRQLIKQTRCEEDRRPCDRRRKESQEREVLKNLRDQQTGNRQTTGRRWRFVCPDNT